MNARKIRKMYKENKWFVEDMVLKSIEVELVQLECDVMIGGLSWQSKDLIFTEIRSLNNIKSKILKEFPEYSI